MSTANFPIRLKEFRSAFARLEEILRVPKGTVGRDDAIIQRFEFNFELAWKTTKAALEIEGVVATTPRAVLQKAFAAGWVDDEKIWLQMIEDRNLMSHTYKEQDAIAVAARVPGYVFAIGQLIKELSTLEGRS